MKAIRIIFAAFSIGFCCICLLQGSANAQNNNLYGTTYQFLDPATGILEHTGVIFYIDPADPDFEIIKDYEFDSCWWGIGCILEPYEGKLYGVVSLSDKKLPPEGSWPYSENKLNGFIFEFSAAAGGVTACSYFPEMVSAVGPSFGRPAFNSLTVFGNFLYGFSSQAIYRYDPVTHFINVLYHFESGVSEILNGGKMTAFNGKLYGIVEEFMFEFDPGTNEITQQLYFSGLGIYANVQGVQFTLYNDRLYANLEGKIIEWDPVNSSVAVVKTGAPVTSSAMTPYNGKFYYAADYASDGGSIIEWDPESNEITTLYAFDVYDEGYMPYINSLSVFDNKIFGMCARNVNGVGGGSVWEYDLGAEDPLRRLVTFDGFNGWGPSWTRLTSVYSCVPSAPYAVTSEATELECTSAQFSGTVNANCEETVVTFEYGETESYGSSIAADPVSVAGNDDVAVAASVEGLQPGTLYHFRTVATNSEGTSYGGDQTLTTTDPVSVSITAILSPGDPTGSGPTTIYLGYGPGSVTLEGTATGGSGFTYAWTASPLALSGLSCTDCAGPLFTPTEEGQYEFTLTATNSEGCPSSADITICVLDINVPDSPGRVYLCHVTSGTSRTLSVQIHSVPPHVPGHASDFLGRCDQSCGELEFKSGGSPGKLVSSPGNPVTVIVYPNPSTSGFTMVVESESQDPASVRLFDLTGRIVYENDGIRPEYPLLVDPGLNKGLYLLHVSQGKHSQKVKIVKN